VQLGQWALANSFFVIAVPIAVLGLPGSFGRFVEHFRSRRQLGDYFRRVLGISLIGLCLASAAILILPEQFSWLLFRQSNSYQLVLWCVITLVSVTIFSFVNELVAALREVRAVSLMQFVQSVSFAAIGLGILSVRPSWTVLLPSFTIACGLATLPGLLVLLTKYRGEFHSTDNFSKFDSRQLWARILPYACALWVMNLLTNLFEISDRYMLLHLLADGGQAAGETFSQGVVGQYHCGRILPNLLTSIALMFGGVILPYISADWEAGQPERIAARLRQMLQSVSIGFMALAIAAMCVAPWLFYYGFGNRYQQAEAILPISMLQAIWISLFMVAQSYLLCIERGKRLALLMFTGLVLNLMLNWWLIGLCGLYGAVLATTIANLLTLMILFWQMSRYGCWLGWGTIVLCLLPLAVAAGPIVASLVLSLTVLVAGRTTWLLSASDRQQIDEAILPQLRRLGLPLRSLWN
jgi:O-antigen/teichoic acid export membrane protein